MEEEIKKKLSYYEQQLPKVTKRFIDSNKRTDRDLIISTQTRIQTYKELIIKKK